MPQNNAKDITQKVASLGFENVHVIFSKDTLKMAYENNIYRWNVRGLIVILDTLTNNVPPETYLEIVTLSNGIPVFETGIRSLYWIKYRNETITKKELDGKIHLTFLAKKEWDELKDIEKINSNLFKFDFIIYPQIYLQNIYFYNIYEAQANIAPALEFSLWKGNKFTGQVIIPVYNDVNAQGYYVRPGFVTISQDFRIPGPIYTSLTLGKFNADRYGMDLTMIHPFKNPHWTLSLNAGLTSWTYFYSGTLYLGVNLSATFNLTASYYLPKFNMQFDVSGGRYIFGDYGMRIDVTRYFGETAVGLYAMYSGGTPNGGFYFTVPLPTSKRGKRHHFRVYPPRYFDFEYNGGTKFLKGRYYKSSPDENRSGDYFNLMYIKNSLH
jgi:hypothetical protein